MHVNKTVHTLVNPSDTEVKLAKLKIQIFYYPKS